MPDVRGEGSWHGCAVIVLAGGSSRRLGRDKLVEQLAGRSLLQTVLDGVPASVPVVVVGPARPLERAPGAVLLTAWEDPTGGGPVAGVAAGLATLAAAGVVVAGVAAGLAALAVAGVAAGLATLAEAEAEAAVGGPAASTTAAGRSTAAGPAPAASAVASRAERPVSAASRVVVLAGDAPRAPRAVPALLAALGPRAAAVAVDGGGRRQPLLAVHRASALDLRLAASASTIANPAGAAAAAGTEGARTGANPAGAAAGAERAGGGAGLAGRPASWLLGDDPAAVVEVRVDDADLADADTEADLARLRAPTPCRPHP